MTFNPDSDLAREVAGQPDDWAGARGQRLPELVDSLPPAGEPVAWSGAARRYFMAQAYAALREGAGHGETDAFAASEPPDRGYDAVLAITRSGTTTEIVDLLRGSAPVGPPRRRRDGRYPVAELADRILTLPSRRAIRRADALRDVHSGPAARLLGEDLRRSRTPRRCWPRTSRWPGRPRRAEQITFVGRGWTIGLAHEAALKLRESAQLWTESYPAMEYRHGPISIATGGRVVWSFGEVPDGLVQAGPADRSPVRTPRIDPLAELVRVHRLCLVKARQADLDPDHPRHLTRSVILPARERS